MQDRRKSFAFSPHLFQKIRDRLSQTFASHCNQWLGNIFAFLQNVRGLYHIKVTFTAYRARVCPHKSATLSHAFSLRRVSPCDSDGFCK